MIERGVDGVLLGYEMDWLSGMGSVGIICEAVMASSAAASLLHEGLC